jgi:hypothetical protein
MKNYDALPCYDVPRALHEGDGMIWCLVVRAEGTIDNDALRVCRAAS